MKKFIILILILSQNAMATAYQPSKLEIAMGEKMIDSWLELEYQGFKDIRSVKKVVFDRAAEHADGGYEFIYKAEVRQSGTAIGHEWAEYYDDLCQSEIILRTEHPRNVVGYDVNIKFLTCVDLYSLED